MLNNSNKEEVASLNPNNIQKNKLIHWFMFFAFPIVYMILNFFIINLSQLDEGYIYHIGGLSINRYTVSGIIAQSQVIVIILITLNPIRRSRFIALLLCFVSGTSSLFNVIFSNRTDAIPGIIIPITSASICLIITSYSKNLKNQMERVLDYSRIVKRNEKMLHKIAFYDTLTGLPNRKMMMDQIDILTESYQMDQNEFVLVYLDLDNFKKINDTMGHNVGDEILRQIAYRWKESCHKEDILGRIGGDEFLLLIRDRSVGDNLSEYLNGFKAAMQNPIIVERKDFYISASCGITKFPQDGKNAHDLFKNADIALYKAKNLGKNDFQFFNQEMLEEVFKRIQLENGLLSAIRNNELYMVFQPQFVSSTKALRGYEALIRWNHPELGPISPSEFIPIAEETGMIIEIGRWILETVLRKFMELREKWKIKAVISINISVRQILEPSFVVMIRDILNKTGFDSTYLELEITESVFISYPDYVIEVIKQLKQMGIRIALDDFGTGYASLNYLQMLPINILKIDKTFIDKIYPYHSMNKMVGAIISLSHQLGIEVVAEGVEREEQLHYLIQHKCDYIQGFYLGKPYDEEQIINMYKQTG